MKSLQDYTIVIRPDDNCTFVAYVPAILGCHAWGQTSDEARAGLIDVFGMIQAEYEEAGRLLPPLPKPKLYNDRAAPDVDNLCNLIDTLDIPVQRGFLNLQLGLDHAADGELCRFGDCQRDDSGR
jgi:predicted RNase H-like HicB family nuclease